MSFFEKTRITDGTLVATVRDTGASDSLNVSIVDASGNQITSFGSSSVTADTELPTAAVLADNTSNPTAPAVGAFPHAFDGSTWDRLQTGDSSVTTSAGSLKIANYNSGQGATGTSAFNVQGPLASDGAAGTIKPILVGGFASATAPADVSADDDAVKAWNLRNGARAVVITAAGALVGATSNALDINIKSGNITGFATAAKQPALGTAGTPSADVITVQGITSMTPLKVDGSGVTQPVSGTVTANMGTVTADPFGTNADVASTTGSISAKLKGIATALGITALDLGTGTGGTRTLRTFQDTAQFVGGTGVDTSATQRVSLATNVALPAGTNAIGKLAANSGVDIGDVDVTSAIITGGAVAHDSPDSGNPIKIGMRAVSHGSTPTSVAAADRTDWLANRAGIPFIMGGHPNVVAAEWVMTSAQTNLALVTPGANVRIVVTAAACYLDADCTVNVHCRLGLAASALGTISNNSATAITGMIISHPDIPPGSGVVVGNGSGILAIGAAADKLLLTCDAATGGSLRIVVTYYTIDES